MPLSIEPWDEPLPFAQREMMRAVTVPNWNLPFENGQRWSSGGPHRDSDGNAWGAVDFSPGSSPNKRVVAIADGRVYRVTCPAGWFLGIDHGGGWRSEYYHLANAQSNLVGQWVPVGTYLGEAASTLPCGGSSTGPHVHLSILLGNPPQPGQGLRPYYPVDGMRFGNYRVRAGASPYQGRWEDLSGRTVFTNFGCCLTSTTPAPQSFTSAPIPTLSGTPDVGSVLTASAGTWQPAATLQYQWRREGAAIPGATGTTYQVTKSDRGARLSVAVTGTRAGTWPATKVSGTLTVPTPVVRRSGATRYDTSAAISAATHTPGVPTAYLASGQVFADALSAAAAAGATDTPVLLTAPDGIPTAVAAELDRLDPGRIVIVGGPAAISDIVMTQARAYTTGEVTRLSGDTRYHSAVLVSSTTFTSKAGDVYIASGTDFADALSAAAAAAGAAGAPVLLSKPSSLPDVVAAELTRLAPQRIVIVGGPAAISEDVRVQLESYAGEVIRLAGGNRFETAAAVAAATTRAPAPSVYLASGLDFADAVSGAAAAASASVPILLTRNDFLPPATGDTITRLRPPRIVVLGGPAAIPEHIARAAAALAP
ncbi:cell wall-binding repeat-containing protein [Microbacterium sp. Sa4CUA7]|uniref:Cell wall-binding repeat-containing protein n=1 Tax=Microbacterium pullorum TaxID=2762236 RepID=A0ABR8S235_9MICO|nr:cell wall-binding repeat-containing protein [Microbacterium pullorum]MBD7957525.1 cell wall-binding repeat-containing protein [Microbacterium pullorum]